MFIEIDCNDREVAERAVLQNLWNEENDVRVMTSRRGDRYLVTLHTVGEEPNVAPDVAPNGEYAACTPPTIGGGTFTASTPPTA